MDETHAEMQATAVGCAIIAAVLIVVIALIIWAL